MGSVGTTNNIGINTKQFEYEAPALEAGKPTKYSRDAFDENYRAAQRLVEGNPDANYMMASLYRNDEMAVMSTQTLKGIQYLINQERENIDIDLDFGVIPQSTADTLKKSLNVVQRTLNNQWKNR